MSGAPTRDRDLRRRLAALEDDRDALRLEVAQLRQSLVKATPPRQARIAKTAGSGYPSAPADTFELVFCDDLASYTETAGDQTPSYTDHSADPQGYGHAIDCAFYPDGAYVNVIEINRQHWIVGGARISKVIDFTLTAAIVGAAASAPATVDAFYDGTDPTSPQTVYNTNGAIAYAAIGSSGQAIWDDYRGRYQIVQAAGSTPAGGGSLWGRTQANWTKNSGDPRVSIKQITGSPARTSSTVSGSAFWCYLPRTHDGDPNVVSGQNVAFVYDQDGTATCVGDYLDAKIGSVRMWVGDKADIPTGWAVMDGVANAAGNGGSGIAFVNGSDQFFPLPTDVDVGGGNGAVGSTTAKDGTTGSNTVTVGAHSEASLEAILADHDASDISNHAADSTDSGQAVIGNHTGNTAGAGTGITASADAHGFSCHNVSEGDYPSAYVECVDCLIDNHVITVTDPTHAHGLGTLTHTDAGHTHSTPAHSHSGTLAHNFTGDLSHGAAACRPELKNIMFIERLDNSV